jgi:NADH dehydrogenase FAD-containing subunit
MAKQSSIHIVILGAGYAGMAAALRLAHKTRRLPVEITLVNGSATFVERIRLHQAAAAEPVRQRSISVLLRGTRVRFVRGWVVALAPQAQQVRLRTDAGSEILAYDYLLYALGSRTDKDSVAGVREHALAMGNPADSELLRQRLLQLGEYDPNPAGEVVVVGGGLTGIESAAEIAERYPTLRVRLVTAGRLGPGLSERGRTYLRRTFSRLGIAVQEGLRVERVEAQALVAANGQSIPFKLCVWAGPFQALPLAREAGLAVNTRGQIIIDAAMRSLTSPSIYVAGDSAAFAPEVGIAMRMACATAMPMAAHAADNLYAELVGEPQRPFRFGYVAQCISLGRHDGLLQHVNADDSPTDRIVTGRPAAWIKEAICRAAALAATVVWVARSYRWWQWEGTAVGEPSSRPALADAQQMSRHA